MAGDNQDGQQDEAAVAPDIEARIAEATKGLKANRDQALREAKQARERLAAFEGVDPEEFKTLKTAAQEAERKRLASEGDFKSLEKQLVEKYERELENERGTGKKYLTAMERYMIDAAAVSELAKHSDSPKLLLPHVKSRMKVVEQDGEFHARIVDENGNVRIGNGQGSSPMTLSELIEEMRQDKEFALAFRGSGSSGGGASKSSGGAGGAKVISKEDLYKGDNLARFARGELKLADA